jgi:FMN phosphatase YigB (HAD superfamily)
VIRNGKLLERHRAVLLDMNGTFMFGQDRFGPQEPFGNTYRQFDGTSLASEVVDAMVRECFLRINQQYEDPRYLDDFPSVPETLKRLSPNLTTTEVDRLTRVFAAHELGSVSLAHVECLKTLATRRPLGLVSNIWGPKGPWLRYFTEAGILDLFQTLVWSSDSRSIKPSPRLFRQALAALGVPARDAIFVGDSLSRDIEPAKTLGMTTVWISCEAKSPNGAADYIVPDLSHILNL